MADHLGGRRASRRPTDAAHPGARDARAELAEAPGADARDRARRAGR